MAGIESALVNFVISCVSLSHEKSIVAEIMATMLKGIILERYLFTLFSHGREIKACH
jgi:hypothetical protein